MKKQNKIPPIKHLSRETIVKQLLYVTYLYYPKTLQPAACPTEEEIKKLEEAVNEVIARQLPVTTEFITQEEAQGRFDLERLPDDASETVRVVKVGDYDECLCIGVHVENTSEIGTFKIISHDWDEEAKRWRMRFKLV